MSETIYVQIGYTQKTHGLKGELKAVIEPQYYEDFTHNKRIFLDIKNTKVPYFISEVRGGSGIILSLEEVTNKTLAEPLQSRQIFLRTKDLIPDHKRKYLVEEDVLEYAELEGYIIEDETLGEIGPIREVLEMPQQEMAFLEYKNKDVLIPLNKQLILSVDNVQKRVKMDLPEGLLDV